MDKLTIIIEGKKKGVKRTFKFPNWKLNSRWAAGGTWLADFIVAFFLRMMSYYYCLFGSKPEESGSKDESSETEEVEIQDPIYAEADQILEQLGVKAKDRKRLLGRAGPCETSEEMVRKCLNR